MKPRNLTLLGLLAVLTLLAGLGLTHLARASGLINAASVSNAGQWIIEAMDVDFEAVDMVSANDGWAVAGDQIYHYDGANWYLVETFDEEEYWLHAIDMVSASDGWAVGDDRATGGSTGTGVILHYNGTAWQPFPSSADCSLYAIDMLSATDGWAVGGYDDLCGLIMHYNGTAWQVITTSQFEELLDIDMISATDGWAVGQDGIHHYNGTNWQTISTDGDMGAISMVSASDGWAVGWSGKIMHYNGIAWSSVSSPITDTLRAVFMISASDGWAAGDSGVILHYNGAIWQSVSSPTTESLTSISMVSASDGWAVGKNGTMLHYNGSSWQTMPEPNLTGPTSGGVYGVDMVSATDGWVVGRYILHYDGATWQAVASSPPVSWLYDVDMVSANDGWAVGTDGVILHYNGANWQSVPSPISAGYLSAVDMLSATDGWAIGCGQVSGSWGGVILQYDGATWQTFYTTTNWTGFSDLDMVSANDGWAVGTDGVILHYNGANWQSVPSPASVGYLGAVDMLSATDGWAVGGDDILHYNGVEWQEVSNPAPGYSLFDVHMVSSSDGWIVGEDGLTLHYDGSSWQMVTRATHHDLNSVSMVDSDTGWAVGDSVILRHIGMPPPPSFTAPHCGVTNNARPNLRGTAAIGSYVQVYANGNPWATASVTTTGVFSTTPTTPLSDGTHTITATASGVPWAGDVQDLSLTVDTSLPFNPVGVSFTWDYPGGGVGARLPLDATGCINPSGWRLPQLPDRSVTASVPVAASCTSPAVQLTYRGQTVTNFTDSGGRLFQATFTPVNTGPATFNIRVTCGGMPHDYGGSVELIDPEGTVYDANMGLTSPISDAVVTLYISNTTTSAWAIWDAWNYPFHGQAQINPQITASDGCYSFMVPVGSYVVQASADGYQSYESSTIEVITEPVHLDIPMQRTAVYLSIILKNYAPPTPSTGPDLIVTGIITDPASPGAGQATTIYVTVKNQGNQATSSWFFIDLYVDPASPPDDRADLGTYYEYGPSGLAPGQTHQVSFSHTFSSAGDHTLYAQVDTYDGSNGSPDYGMIQENNEGNNIYGPVSVGVSGASATREEAPPPDSGPRPTPAAGP